jgi:hypothetical protein
VTEASRLSTTAQALALALETLGDTLAQARYQGMADSETAIDARVGAFRSAALEAAATGEALTPDDARVLTAALSRCRRLGVSLTLLTGSSAPPADAPCAYTPVGLPLSQADGGSFLTARG